MSGPSPASVLCFALGLGLAGLGIARHVGAASAIGDARVTPVVLAVQRAAPAVVNVTTDSGGRGGGRGSGAGVIVHPDGYVVTNSHVVRGAARVYCSLARAVGGQAYEARVLENDPSHDLALLRIAGGPFPYVSICSTCDVMVGETAIARVTMGIVSAKGRTATFSSGHTLQGLIQTDASINLGNSGGALLNVDGELIGINSAIHANAQGIAFTVPADDVQRMLDRHLGAASRPSPPPLVGVAPAPRSAEPLLPTPSPRPTPTPSPRVPAARPARPPVGLSLASGAAGVTVATITPGSNAEIAGLRAGDVIALLDGSPVASPSALAGTFNVAASGQTYLLTIRRADRTSTLIVVIP
jgi:S1-C subfamily serine protease